MAAYGEPYHHGQEDDGENEQADVQPSAGTVWCGAHTPNYAIGPGARIDGACPIVRTMEKSPNDTPNPTRSTYRHPPAHPPAHRPPIRVRRRAP